MNPVSSNQKFRKILFWFTTIFFLGHIVLALLCIFFTVDFLPKKINSVYNKLIILGPFFNDKAIAISPHLYRSTFSQANGWSPYRDVANEKFSDFLQYPWKYGELKWSDYERFVARKATPEIDSLKYIDGSEGEGSSELIQYASLGQSSQADSIRLLYLWNYWQPESQSAKTDTAFNVVFKLTQGVAPN